MDIFKFHNPTSPTKFQEGEIIDGFESKMWIERYLVAGEFTLVAPVDSGVKDKLPIGSFISHINTKEVMIVEDHEINDEKGSESKITITGRGFETFFENRIVGANKSFPTNGIVSDFMLPEGYTWDQAVTLINNHVRPEYLTDSGDGLPFVTMLAQVTGDGIHVARPIKRGKLYDKVLELLLIENLGIKIIRPGPWSPLGASSPDLAVIIHIGVDRSQELIFSYETGEIESADYLWSNRNSKNGAVVTGKWVEVIIPSTETGYNRRMTYIDASSIDQVFAGPPGGGDLYDTIAIMEQIGREAIMFQNDVALTKADLSKEAVKAVYRTDYDVGDLITTYGNYHAGNIMRVSEYVETEDETGESGYPTLTNISEE